MTRQRRHWRTSKYGRRFVAGRGTYDAFRAGVIFGMREGKYGQRNWFEKDFQKDLSKTYSQWKRGKF